MQHCLRAYPAGGWRCVLGPFLGAGMTHSDATSPGALLSGVYPRRTQGCARPSPVAIVHGHGSPLAYLAERSTGLACKRVEREVGASLGYVGQCLIG